MDIQSTKIELVKMILEIENPQIIERIYVLLKNETSDFWDELTIEQRAELDQAIKDIDRGDTMDWDEYKRSIVKKLIVGYTLEQSS